MHDDRARHLGLLLEAHAAFQHAASRSLRAREFALEVLRVWESMPRPRDVRELPGMTARLEDSEAEHHGAAIECFIAVGDALICGGAALSTLDIRLFRDTGLVMNLAAQIEYQHRCLWEACGSAMRELVTLLVSGQSNEDDAYDFVDDASPWNLNFSELRERLQALSELQQVVLRLHGDEAKHVGAGFVPATKGDE